MANDAAQDFAAMAGPSNQPKKPAQSPLQKAGQWLHSAENSKPAHLLDYFAQLPAEGITAVLGAPQRMAASQIANFKKNPGGVVGAATSLLSPYNLASPNTRREVGNMAYAAFHPNDPSVEESAESATGVNKLMTNDPRFRGKLRNFLIRTGFETATDPLTFVGGGTAVAGENALRGIGRVGTAALQSSKPIVRKTAEEFLTNVGERQTGYTPEQIAKVNTALNKHVVQERGQEAADAQLLKDNEAALHRGVTPASVRSRLNTAQRMSDGAFAHAPPSTIEPTVHNLYDRVEERLGLARNKQRDTGATNDLMQALGIDRPAARKIIHSQSAGWAGFAPLRAISKTQVEALTTAGVPHMKNVGIMGQMSMGEPGLVKAAGKFVTGKSSGRLEEGGSDHFGSKVLQKYSPARLVPAPIRRLTTGALDRWDQALRETRLEMLDKTNPEMSEAEKLDRVNQDLGAYNLSPKYVKNMKGLGANFPQWHGYVVPTAVTRALLRNPGNIGRLGRYEQNANDEFAPDSPYRMTLGGPVDEYASALADPARAALAKYPSYFGGPSTIGPAAYLLRSAPGAKHDFLERGLQFGAGFLPFGNVGVDALMNPFKSPLSTGARAAAGVTGVYTQKRPPQSMQRTQKPAKASAAGSGDPFKGMFDKP